MSLLPLPFRVPLEGTVLIEASAGTGKTYALERLIARHILWNGHPVDSVLAVTFTNAAAADIRQRLHGFLRRCLAYDGKTADGDIEILYAGRPAEVSEDQLRSRLALALSDFDRAAVYTIHGFCQRLLQDYALDTGQPIPPPVLLEDETALRAQVCEEFWRRSSLNPDFADILDTAFGSPQRMTRQLTDLLSAAALMPEQPALLKPDFASAFAALKDAYRQDGAGALPVLLAAFDDGTLNRQSHKREAIEKSFADLARFIADHGRSALPDTGGLCADSLKVKKGKSAPRHPFLDALVPWNRFAEALAGYRDDCRIFLCHALCDYARMRLSVLKQQAGVIGFDDIIDAVHAALTGTDGERLARKIRDAYPVALVDEFQDTDERQWRIFECLYRGAAPASLVLIGDPKQAIYGFRGGDIHTYLKVQALAEHKETLAYNFRSNQSLLHGIESVFLARHAHPFPEPGIAFVQVTAGRNGEHLFLQGSEAPALSWFGPGFEQKTGIADARRICARQCADAIAGLLNQSHSGAALVQSGETTRALCAGDIAVLVSSHREAALIQEQLRKRGVPAVCVSREILFESYEAVDILQILHAAEHPLSAQARASACGGLLVRSAMAESGQAPDWQEMAQRLVDAGPLAAFGRLLEAAYRALPSRTDGERRLANYLQVLELMQAEFTAATGSGHCLDWLGRQIALAQNAGADNVARPRLESSKPRVRIMTLHQSKGLEFGLVFMPFTAIHASGRSPFARYFDGNRRCLHLDVRNADAETRTRIDAERASENLRLLYVGMTRAKFGLRCSWGLVEGVAKSPLGHLLLADTPADTQACSSALAGFSYAIETERTDARPDSSPTESSPPVPAWRSKPVPWQISSFSGLHRDREIAYPRPADDETNSMQNATPYRGADFGNALHLVLEHARAADWPDGRAGPSAFRHCRQALLDFGYSPGMAEQGVPVLAELASNTLLTPLPEGPCLLDLPASEKRHELEFHLKLEQADSADILSLLHHHGYCRKRERFGFNRVLNGLLTGKIDLLYRYAGKVFIVDYKSNTLSDYSPNALRQSIDDQEYDLQYLLYTVAVHRWLRQRITDYAYERHFGGIRYLYARGLDPAIAGRGIYSDRPAEDLVAGLDRCFSPGDHGHD